MAVDYTLLFTRLGRFVHECNSMIGLQGTDLMGDDHGADDILDEYEADRDLVEGLQQTYEGFASSVAGWISTLLNYMNRTLADLQTELNAPDASPATILALLVDRMVEDAETVDGSAVAVDSITADGGNVGSGLLKVDITTYDGVNDERVKSQDIRVTCTGDRFVGAAEGAERFEVVGLPASSPYSYETLGDGVGPTLSVSLYGGNIVLNPDFETFTVADTPDSWTIDDGVAGTHIKQELTNFHTGESALKFLSDHTQATIGVSQLVAASLTAGVKYACGVWLRETVTLGAGSNLKIALTGTGMSDVILFDGDPNGLGTSFVLKHAFFYAPLDLPDDLTLVITWTSVGGITATRGIIFDGAALVQATAFGHAHYAIFRGDTDFLRGDTIRVVTSNNGAGTFQAFFGRFYDVMLPSDLVGGETIDDALAE